VQRRMLCTLDLDAVLVHTETTWQRKGHLWGVQVATAPTPTLRAFSNSTNLPFQARHTLSKLGAQSYSTMAALMAQRKQLLAAAPARARCSAVVCRATAAPEERPKVQQLLLSGVVASAILLGSAAAPDEAFAAARSGGRVSANGFAKRRAGCVAMVALGQRYLCR
jgi:hypothetical protein